MIKRLTKTTSLLLAAASIMSMVPMTKAEAAETLKNKDATVDKAVAYKNGKYIYSGYITEDDETELHYNNGQKEKVLEDEDGEGLISIDEKFGDKYVTSEGDIIDMETGKVIEDTTEDDFFYQAKSGVVSKIRKSDRWKDLEDELSDDKDEDKGAISKVSSNQEKFEDNYYEVKGTEKKDGLQRFGYTTPEGKFIDCSYDLNIQVYSDNVETAKVSPKMIRTAKERSSSTELVTLTNDQVVSLITNGTTITKAVSEDSWEIKAAKTSVEEILTKELADESPQTIVIATITNDKLIEVANKGTLNPLSKTIDAIETVTINEDNIIIAAKSGGEGVTSTITKNDLKKDLTPASLTVKKPSDGGNEAEKVAALQAELNNLGATAEGEKLSEEQLSKLGYTAAELAKKALYPQGYIEAASLTAATAQVGKSYYNPGNISVRGIADTSRSDGAPISLAIYAETYKKEDANETGNESVWGKNKTYAQGKLTAAQIIAATPVAPTPGATPDAPITVPDKTVPAGEGKMYTLADVESKAKNDTIQVTSLEFVKYLTQDDNYIYSLIKVGVQGSRSLREDNDALKTSDTEHYYVQKVSKEQGDKQDGIYKPKTTECYAVSQALADDDSYNEAYKRLILDPTGDIIYTAVNGDILLNEIKDDSVSVSKIMLSKNSKIDKPGSSRQKLTVKAAKFDTDNLDKGQTRESTNKDELKSYSIDANGNVWVINKGKIYKFDSKEMEWTRKAISDSDMDSLDVYDNENMIVWSTTADIYATVSGESAGDDGEEPTNPDQPDNPDVPDNPSDDVVQHPEGWSQEGGAWYLYGPNNEKLTGWQYVDGKWYFMDITSGVMQTGWLYDAGNWFYLNPTYANGYGPTGSMRTGWINDNGSWYYCDARCGGRMITGNFTDPETGKAYYLKENSPNQGAMQ